jgi:hypothetical protein
MLNLVVILVLAQAPDSWVGKRVITHLGTVLEADQQDVDDEGRGRDLSASGGGRDEFRVYRVERSSGGRLWLAAEDARASGWAEAGRVVRFDRAIDYLTGVIRSRPTSASYNARGVVWHGMGKHGVAILDYNVAIQLDPKNKSAGCGPPRAIFRESRNARASSGHGSEKDDRRHGGTGWQTVKRGSPPDA